MRCFLRCLFKTPVLFLLLSLVLVSCSIKLTFKILLSKYVSIMVNFKKLKQSFEMIKKAWRRNWTMFITITTTIQHLLIDLWIVGVYQLSTFYQSLYRPSMLYITLTLFTCCPYTLIANHISMYIMHFLYFNVFLSFIFLQSFCKPHFFFMSIFLSALWFSFLFFN